MTTTRSTLTKKDVNEDIASAVKAGDLKWKLLLVKSQAVLKTLGEAKSFEDLEQLKLEEIAMYRYLLQVGDDEEYDVGESIVLSDQDGDDEDSMSTGTGGNDEESDQAENDSIVSDQEDNPELLEPDDEYHQEPQSSSSSDSSEDSEFEQHISPRSRKRHRVSGRRSNARAQRRRLS